MRKLFRSRSDRKLAGVCGGLSQYFNFDATLLRVLFVVITLVGAMTPLVVYLVMAFIVPNEEIEPPYMSNYHSGY